MRFVSADGIRTRYSSWGVNGPPIVLVHGAAESSDTWAPVAERLAARYRVYAFDVSGWGYSERRGPFDAEHGAAQLIGVMDALRLPRATLVGHSSGAGIVAAAALRAPGRVGGLVFVDGDALDTGAGAGADDVRKIVRNPYRTTLLRLGIRSDWVIRKIYGSQCGPACPRLDRAGVDRWRRPFQVAGAESALWRMEGVVGLPERRVGELARLNVPKSVVFGADDDVFSRSAPYDTARLIGAPAPTIVPDARHLPIVSHPDRVATAITALPPR
ncbi:alpha/beta fold hydrolase [Actinomadura sp. J1-007]|uniref:alpha/beta fold hydrolase n=1 Tax=Actinomadura sp. J1-007 TaxID=2661913 RepID=UPI0013706554|nr:alpha/beta hydrolase [Actinomadura sp. J1-007]